jgi:hypothetical protein
MGYNGTKSKLVVGQVVDLPDGKAEVTAYNGVMSVTLKFLDTGYETTTQSGHILRKTVRDRMKPLLFGRGFMVQGPYVGSNENKAYTLWMGIFNRCYGGHNKPYLGCEVDPQWYNFQEFAEWCQWQKGFKEDKWAIDKDIILKGNKVYGPEFCAFVPREINNAVVNTRKAKGYTKTRSGDKFMSGCAKVYLGTFDTKEEASTAYFIEKRKQMNQLSLKWKGLVEERLLSSLEIYY